MASLVNCEIEDSGFQFGSASEECAYSKITSEHHNQVLNAHKTYYRSGTITKVTADGSGVTPSQNASGQQGEIVEAYANASDITERSPIWVVDHHQIWAKAGISKTYRYYMQSNFAANITRIKLTAEYMDTASSGHYAETSATATIIPRTSTADWSQYIEIAVTPANDGWVRLSLGLYQYEAAKYVWVDPQLIIY